MKDFLQRTLPSRGRWLRTSYATAVAALLFTSCSKPEAEPAAVPDNSTGSSTAIAGGLVTDGVYTLTTKLVPSNGGASQRLDVAGGTDQNGQQVGVWDQNNLAPQSWRFVHQGGNIYTITSQVGQKNKVLDANNSDGGIKQASRVSIYASSQRWLLEDAGSGYFFLTPEAVRNQSPKLRLDVAGGKSTRGTYTNVHIWADNGWDGQKWKLEAVAGGGGTTPGTGTPPPSTGAVSGPPAGSGSWTKTFEDNFDFFDSNKWTKAWPSGNGNAASATFTGKRIDTYYQADGAHISVANGKLYIKTERKAQGGLQFTSGVVTTAGTPNPFLQKFGYFEVRMKPASSPGNDPCFWAFPLSKPADNTYKELDFAEFGGKRGAVALTSHMPFVKPAPTFSKLGTYTDTFRTYGVLWESGKATLYIDGVLQGSISGNIVDEQGVLILSDEVRNVGDQDGWFGNSNNFQGPIFTEVEWVRVWRRS
ncbi:RICIN domain-containing protein [Hymenobacter weizhouensis]|uniref:RICIN domain-containing protein n=1 Tax=Hymenobacter sp. YIM 151500-1 TaxID=2987689 RepID=UPI002227A15D|nr:RICIN domain-containing protein [Hymenobacter sp. YIM 151500-1]UYZ63636.1 RICIN domain-containing protein [Hymenobacter sp. YIM 151500-1]